MAVIECSRCGGRLEVNSDMSVGKCLFCDSVITIPREVEKKSNLYNRANYLRRSNEFDKAEEIYEDILKEDNTDAEAHWGLLMCCYGIEYVDDPDSGKKVPTCHRTERDSIFTQPSFLAAMEYADELKKEVYQEQAQYIDKIQQKILKIADQEEPYDVFICYKQTDDQSGERTPDSFIGEDLYYELTKAGYKVFFAQQSLRPGTDYEPYIFSALYSARALIVIATNSDYVNAVWVRNEWNRFLAMMKKDSNKTIIPVYKDMSPYEFPKALSRFHAMDVTRLGFLQDVRDGINRIVRKPQPTANTGGGGGDNVDALLKRGYIFLEDGDTTSAKSYFNKVLDQNPEEAQAYWGMMLIDLKCTSSKMVAGLSIELDNNSNYQKAIRFGNDKQISEYSAIRKQCKDNLVRDIEEKDRNNRLAREKEQRRVAYHDEFNALKTKYAERDASKDQIFALWRNLTADADAAEERYNVVGGFKPFNKKVFWISLLALVIPFLLVHYLSINPVILENGVVSIIAGILLFAPLVVLAGVLIWFIISIFNDNMGCIAWIIVIVGAIYIGGFVGTLIGELCLEYLYAEGVFPYHLIPVLVGIGLITWQIIRFVRNKTKNKYAATLYGDYISKKNLADKEWKNVQQRAYEELNTLNEKNSEFSGELHKGSELFE